MISLAQRRSVWAGIAAAALVVLGGMAIWHVARPRPGSVRGVLMDVQAQSLIMATQVTLRDEAGTVCIFEVDPEVITNREEPQNAAHLRMHMVLAEPMIVRYRVTPDGLIAVRIRDGE